MTSFFFIRVAFYKFHVDTEASEVPDKHVKCGRCVRFFDAFSGNDGIERRRATQDVVGFNGEYFAQAVCGAVAEERPDLHFSDALTSVLRLAAQGLLRRKRVRTDGAHVNFVFYHVVEFQHVHDADGDRLCEWFASASVEKNALPVFCNACFLKLASNLFLRCARERRYDGLIAEHFSRETQVEFEYLSQVHTGRNAERSQNDVHRIPVLVVWHVFFGKHARDDAFVAVATGELVSDGNGAQLRDFYMHTRDDAAFQLVAVLAREYLDADNAAAFPSFHPKRCVFHVLRLFTEDGVEEALFRGQLRLAFRGHFSDQDIARTHFRADADDSFFIQIAELEFADVRDVVRRYFGPELRVANDAHEFLHVYRREACLFC